jgi:hypothetical protein
VQVIRLRLIGFVHGRLRLAACLAGIAVCLSLPFRGEATSQSVSAGYAGLEAAGTKAYQVAQDEDQGDQGEVPPAQVEKYIDVYKAMQRNHGLTVEKAAAQQGLTLKAFRNIERKIERNDPLRQQVRNALRAASKASPRPTNSPSP